MEDYEDFCKKYFAKIQSEAIKDTSALAQPSMSIIQFHGVAVLSPLLDFEKKKEMRQYRQKAKELETSKQSNRKKTALLSRVHEILENVQVRKAPSVSDVNVEGAERTETSESRSVNGFAILPSLVGPLAFTAHSGSAKLESTLKDLSLGTNMDLKSTDKGSVASTEDSTSPNKMGSPEATQSDDRAHNHIVNYNKAQLMPQMSVISATKEESDAPRALKESPDPYLMSLQNLLKKSRECIEREQTRHSMRCSSSGSVNESHSDKETDAIKISDSLKEKVRFVHRSRSCSPVALDKPSLNKSNILLQGAPTQMNSINTVGLSSYSKADIPARSRTPSSVDTESDEELKSNFTVDYESTIVKCLTGSYAKLPSPEPSLSPKMHRRRPRTSSVGHIVINYPVNACDLSPVDKSKAMGHDLPESIKNINICDPLSNFAIDETGVCVKGQLLEKCTSETLEVSSLGKQNLLCPQILNVLENGVSDSPSNDTTTLVAESQVRDQTSNVASKSYGPPANLNSPESMNLPVDGFKPNSLTEKSKRASPMELNKSYDVDTPSPMLLQDKVSQQAMDTPNLNEQFLDNSFENRVKRRLDLDMDSACKENNPLAAVMVRTSEHGKRLQHNLKSHSRLGSGYSNKSDIPNHECIGDNILKTKMQAFEEMRKRLEEQHAQQLSLLIAEQEREQESLHREIEQQERRLKDKNSDTSDSPKAVETHIINGIGLDWRKRNESGISDMKWSRVDEDNSSTEYSMGSMNTSSQHSFVSTNDSSFYHLKSAPDGTPAPRSVTRARPRWSQVFSQGMQIKLNKVTALAKGFLTRRLMQTDKLKQLKKTVHDTAEFLKMFQSEVPMKRGAVSAQDASLQERVLAQLRAALYEIHDIFFVMDASERMSILEHDREVLREKMIRQMEKMKSPRERVSLSAATQKSLDRKKLLRAVEMGMPNKKTALKPRVTETRILQPTQGQNAPLNKLLSRRGISETKVEQSGEKPPASRVHSKVIAEVFAGRTQKKKPNVVTI
ncbi:centriolar coiled-coil protein of 110 kDa isoform X2 [Pleurodeles waltl]|uniref:centriolar coiled-coil protein of 110 kDa isoform X2 n=1 Tax=Pleurodeles waltl TaxID=8319 RepID=UPI003709C5AD